MCPSQRWRKAGLPAALGAKAASPCGRQESILGLPRQHFLLSRVPQLRKLASRSVRFLRAPLPPVDLGHFVIRQRVLGVQSGGALEIRQSAWEIVLLHTNFPAKKIRWRKPGVGLESAVHGCEGLRT